MKKTEENTGATTVVVKNSSKGSVFKILIVIVLLVGVYLAGLFGVGQGIKDYFDKDTLSVETIRVTLEPASDLITQKYCYTNASRGSNSKKIFSKYKLPFTTDEYILKYEGTISIGYDLSKAELKVDNQNKVISIKLPKEKIVASEVDEDSVEFVTVSNSVFNSTDAKLTGEIRKNSDKIMRKRAMKNKNFINGARKNAKDIMTLLLTENGDTKDYCRC